MAVAGVKSISFKGVGVIDLGASTPDGSCKLRECDDNGKALNQGKTVVNIAHSGSFENNDQFVRSVGDRFAEFYKNLDKKGLSELTVFLPGATYDDTCIKTPNLKDASGKGLTDIDFSGLISYLKEKGIEIRKDCKLNVLQDSMGIGLSTLKNMVKGNLNEYLVPGSDHTAIMTGGGCGIGKIEVLEDGQVLVKGAGSNFLSDESGAFRVSDIGASVKATLQEFSKEMKFSDEATKAIVNAGVGEILFSPKTVLQNEAKTQKLKQALEATGKYVVEETPEKITFAVKSQFEPMYRWARTLSLGKYAKAIAQFMPVRLAEGPSSFIVTGPFAFAVDDCLKKEYNKTLPKLIEEKFEKYNSDEYKLFMDKYNFKIVCDKEKFAIADNTDCSEILGSSKTFGKRRNWMMVDTKGFAKRVQHSLQAVL